MDVTKSSQGASALTAKTLIKEVTKKTLYAL